ncbi:uncharacterized protein [Physcomitrium patens]|uniref:uncharacterized protein n=1 Tax=Physcomitrium patens TaxID=3218 RepID=UPI00024AD6BC
MAYRARIVRAHFEYTDQDGVTHSYACQEPSHFFFLRETGKVQAWIWHPQGNRRGPSVGYYDRFQIAARQQDRGNLKVNPGRPLNYDASDYEADQQMPWSAMTNKNFIHMLRSEGHSAYNVVDKSACFRWIIREIQTRESDICSFLNKWKQNNEAARRRWSYLIATASNEQH